ncbi:MAG: dockerin type I repeat-containing protein [Planctomycetota bacterium]|nr:dockerin type I repeat-containing protein [Planctomycetota bacterium]
MMNRYRSLAAMGLTVALASTVQADSQSYVYVDLGINSDRGDEPYNLNGPNDTSVPFETAASWSPHQFSFIPYKNVLFRLNDSGRVVGWVMRKTTGGVVPVAAPGPVTNRTTLETDFVQLETPDGVYGPHSWATGVSNNGVIVGLRSNTWGTGQERTFATAWEQGKQGWSANLLPLDQPAGGDSGGLDVIDTPTGYSVCGGVSRSNCEGLYLGLRAFRYSSDSSDVDVISGSNPLRSRHEDDGDTLDIFDQLAFSFLDESDDGQAVGHGNVPHSLEERQCIQDQILPCCCCWSMRDWPTQFDFNANAHSELSTEHENVDGPCGYLDEPWLWDNSAVERDTMGSSSVGYMTDRLSSNRCASLATYRLTPAHDYVTLPVTSEGNEDTGCQWPSSNYLGLGIGTSEGYGKIQVAGYRSPPESNCRRAMLWERDTFGGGDWSAIDIQSQFSIDLSGLSPSLDPCTLTLRSAHDVNRQGWIVGIAVVASRDSSESHRRPFLLIPTEPQICFGDLNGDGVVDGVDIGLLLIAWGECPAIGDCEADWDCVGDLNFDGQVDAADLGLILACWGSISG